MRLTRTAATPIALAALLTLTACTSGGDDPETAEPTASDEATEGGDEQPEDGADGDAAAAGGPDCLAGTWSVDVSSVGESMLSAPGMEELNPQVEVTGTSTVTFDGSAMTTVYEDQVSSVTIELEGAPVTTTTSYDGTLVAAYTATDTELTISDVDLSGLTVRNTSIVDGQETEIPGIESAEASGVPLGGVSTYECTDDELRLTPQVEGVDTTGFTQVMTRD
ncbi:MULTISPECIES: hypothetical protein [unclassified Actinotalea]|uniref:hypothetical protein n=1 Tax=unclassified Actinotalea TaxID=2638618 RepID=UPI0015F6142D|nr:MULTISPECIES: hypothetical protein [unclassified Actinotalea]